MPHLTNWPLAWTTARHIIAHPEQHEQEMWMSSCGTMGCYAGWAAHFTGWEIRDEDFGDPDGVSNLRKDGIEMRVRDIAVNELGLYDPVKASMLFNSQNDLFEVLDVLIEWAIKDGEIVPADIAEAHQVARVAHFDNEVDADFLD